MHVKLTASQQIPSVNTTKSLHTIQATAVQTTFFGLPRFEWTLTLLGFCIYTFTIITYKVNIADVGAVIGLLGIFFTKSKFRVPFPVWYFAGFLLWALLASFASPFPEIARDRLADGFKLLLIMVVAVNALRTAGQLRFYLIFLLVCFIMYPVRGAMVNYMFGYDVFGRALWNYIYGNPNDLAALCLLALGIAVAIRMSTPSRNLVRFSAGIAAILLLLLILMTQSRGAFLGLFVFLSALFIHTIKKNMWIATCMTAVIIIIAINIPHSFLERILGIKMLFSTSTLYQLDDHGSAASRFEIIQVAWKIFVDHKFFGVGYGAYKSVNSSYAPHLGAMDTHNTYLNLATELGLPGLILWLALVGSVMLYAHRSQRWAGNKELAVQQRWIWWGFVAYLVAGVFGSYASLSFPYLTLAMLWCSGNLLHSTAMLADNGAKTSGAR